MRTPQLRAALALLLAVTPCWLLLDDAPFMWTDVAEFSERATVAASAAELWRMVISGVPDHYYRPSVFVLNALNYWLLGERPWTYRALNLTCHLLNVWLVSRLVRGPLRRAEWATTAAALFAVHPVVVTSLRWVADRTDLVATAASLLATWAGARFMRRGHWGAACGALLALFVGMGAKESACACLAIPAVLAWRARQRIRYRALALLLGQALIVGLWLQIRTRVPGAPVLAQAPLDLLSRLALAARIHLEYMFQLAAPMQLRVCDATWVPEPRLFWAALLATLPAIALLRWLTCTRSATTALVLCGAWVIAFLLPTSGLAPLKHIRADRYLYSALPGLSVLLSAALHYHLRGWLRPLVTGTLYAYLAATLLLRGERFASDETLWTYETQRNTACLEGQSYLARDAWLRGSYEATLTFAGAVPEVQPKGLLAFVDRESLQLYAAMSLMTLGRNAEAERLLLSISTHAASTRNRAEAAYDLGLLALRAHNPELALTRLSSAVTDASAVTGTLADALLLRSLSLLQLRRVAAASADFARYSELARTAAAVSGERLALVQQVRSALLQAGAAAPRY